MTNSPIAAKLAEALRSFVRYTYGIDPDADCWPLKSAEEALREYDDAKGREDQPVAQAVPVAWLIKWHRPDSLGDSRKVSFDRCHPDDGTCVPLYTQPQQVLLYCDSEVKDCERNGEMFDGGGFYASATDVRFAAKKHGWTRVNGKDYCSSCTAKRKEARKRP